MILPGALLQPAHTPFITNQLLTPPLAMEAMFTVNNLWVLIATALVFIMHLGFASLEAGFVQRKKRRQHPIQKLDDYLHRAPDLLLRGL